LRRAPGPGAAVVVNAGGHGFYRVRYGPDLLAALIGRLTSLTPLERYGLLDDAWAGPRFRGRRD
jgi:puromycin-sensitive aminopeptidase